MENESLSGAPLISVVVPVYNVEKYLVACVESVLAQTFPRFELILVDDGSPDHSGELCDAFAKKDSRVRVFHKPNGGVTSARKLGVEKARGEWICFVDGDDLLLPDALSALFAPTKNAAAEIDLVQGGTLREMPEAGALREHASDSARGNAFHLAGGLEFAREVASYRFVFFSPAPHGKIIRKTLFSETAALDIPAEIFVGEDALANMRLAKKIRKAARIREDVYFYRVNFSGVMRTFLRRGTYTRDYVITYSNFAKESFAGTSAEWQDAWKILISTTLGTAYLAIPNFKLNDPALAPFIQALRERPDLIAHLSTKLALLKTRFPFALVPDRIFKLSLRALFSFVRKIKSRRGRKSLRER